MAKWQMPAQTLGHSYTANPNLTPSLTLTPSLILILSSVLGLLTEQRSTVQVNSATETVQRKQCNGNSATETVQREQCNGNSATGTVRREQFNGNSKYRQAPDTDRKQMMQQQQTSLTLTYPRMGSAAPAAAAVLPRQDEPYFSVHGKKET